MPIETVATDRAPQAIGPYSQAVVHGGIVYCSGQISLDPASGTMRGDDVEEQTRIALRNLAAVLDAAGSGLDRVLKTTVYLQDMADFPVMNAAYAEAFGAHRPARAAIQAARLPKGALVEIDAIAVAG